MFKNEHKEKIDNINDCLLNKYNLTYDKLCTEGINTKNVWVSNSLNQSNELSFNDECYIKNMSDFDLAVQTPAIDVIDDSNLFGKKKRITKKVRVK